MRTRACWLATAALLLAACTGAPADEEPAAPEPTGGAGSSSTTADGPGEAGGPALAPPFALISDSGSGARARIGPSGGTLVVTDRGGTTYELVVPPGALWETVEITATPVASFGPGNEDGRGVVFGPTGLQFATDARLNVAPPGDVPVERQLVLEFSDDGSEVIAAEPVLDDPAIVMYVGHFSGYGFADLANVARETWVGWRTDNAEEDIQNELRDVLATERYQQLLGVEQGADTSKKVADALMRYEKDVVRPRLANADTSCAAAKQAIRTALGYSRTLQLLGVPESGDLPLTLAAVVTPGITPCEKEATEKCRANRDPGALLDFWKGVNQVLPGTFALDRAKAELICDPRTYRIVGGLQDFQVSEEVCPITEPFRLSSDVGTMKLSGGLSGTYTFKGAYDASYTGTYVITFPDGPRRAGTMVGQGGGSISGQPGSGAERYTVTPVGPC